MAVERAEGPIDAGNSDGNAEARIDRVFNDLPHGRIGESRPRDVEIEVRVVVAGVVDRLMTTLSGALPGLFVMLCHARRRLTGHT